VADDPGPVVSNTTPIINLVGVGMLNLLPSLYGLIRIPEAVLKEYNAGKAAADPALDELPWLQIVPDVVLDSTLPLQLGIGEASAISLALVENARVVLLDEAFGRRLALQRGLPVVGTLAVLLAAKQDKRLSAVGPIIDAMILQGRRISPTLREQIIRAAGE
jgi:predicted nucleic acid-binding protein